MAITKQPGRRHTDAKGRKGQAWKKMQLLRERNRRETPQSPSAANHRLKHRVKDGTLKVEEKVTPQAKEANCGRKLHPETLDHGLETTATETQRKWRHLRGGQAGPREAEESGDSARTLGCLGGRDGMVCETEGAFRGGTQKTTLQDDERLESAAEKRPLFPGSWVRGTPQGV